MSGIPTGAGRPSSNCLTLCRRKGFLARNAASESTEASSANCCRVFRRWGLFWDLACSLLDYGERTLRPITGIGYLPLFRHTFILAYNQGGIKGLDFETETLPKIGDVPWIV